MQTHRVMTHPNTKDYSPWSEAHSWPSFKARISKMKHAMHITVAMMPLKKNSVLVHAISPNNAQSISTH